MTLMWLQRTRMSSEFLCNFIGLLTRQIPSLSYDYTIVLLKNILQVE